MPRVHAIARCCECDFSEDWYLDAETKAKGHVLESGHRVEMEIGFTFERETTDDMMDRIGGVRESIL